MPQIFQVLRCYKCSVFQVHQTRKDNKWVCKICGEKQSVKRHYGLGTSRDCRTHVQKLNKMRGNKEEVSATIVNSDDDEYNENVDSNTTNVSYIKKNASKDSKWSAYIDKAEEYFETSEPVYHNDKEVVLEMPQKRIINRKYKQQKYLKKTVDNEVNMNQTDSIRVIPARKVDHSSIESFDSDFYEVNLKSEIKPQIDTNVKNQNKIIHSLPQKSNEGSKWAQFIDSQDFDKNCDKNTEKNCNKHPLFSLCDDSEIDTILDL